MSSIQRSRKLNGDQTITGTLTVSGDVVIAQGNVLKMTTDEGDQKQVTVAEVEGQNVLEIDDVL